MAGTGAYRAVEDSGTAAEGERDGAGPAGADGGGRPPADGRDGRAGDESGSTFLPVIVGSNGKDWAALDAGLPVEVLGARICAMATRMAQATFHWLQMIAEFDRRDGWAGVGIRSCAHWLAWTCSMAAGTAREHVRVARALESLPRVSAEMAAGRLSYAKVREITRVADRVDESTLVDLARTATASQLARTIRGFRAADDQRGTQEQRRYARWRIDDDGSVLLTARLPTEEGAAVIAALEAARDDLTRLSGRTSDTEPDARSEADAGASAEPATCAVAERNAGSEPGAGGGTAPTGGKPEQTVAPAGPGAERSPTRMPEPVDPADMLLQWARGYLSAAPEDRSGEDRTMVVVHVNAEHLLPAEHAGGGAHDTAAVTSPAATGTKESDPATGRPEPPADAAQRSRGNAETDTADTGEAGDPDAAIDRSAIPVDCCTVAGIGGVGRDTAARLACDAMVVGIIRGAGGVVLAHGRRRRTVGAAQRRLLTIRDGHCQFPSCTRTSHLEAHTSGTGRTGVAPIPTI